MDLEVFLVCHDFEIAPSIVKSVAIDMVDDSIFWTVCNLPVDG